MVGLDNSGKPNTKEVVEQMQKDALLLLNFISERKEKSLIVSGQMGFEQEDLLRIIGSDAGQVMAKPEDWGRLLKAVDELAFRARPATVESIRFTGAYVGRRYPVDEAATDRQERTVRQLRTFYWIIGLTGIAAVAVTMMLLNQVLAGQMILGRLEQLRAVQTSLYPQFAQAAADLPEGADVCPRDQEGRKRMTEIQQGLCGRQDDLNVKFEVTYLQLESWNITTDRIHHALAIPNWIRPPIGELLARKVHEETIRPAPPRPAQDADPNAPLLSSPRPGRPAEAGLAAATTGAGSGTGAGERDGTGRDGAGAPTEAPTEAPTGAAVRELELQGRWNRTELWTEIMLAGLATYWIPALLGFVGACVFVFRRLHAHLEAWTLEGRERLVLFPRVLLGLMLGALVSLVFEAVNDGATSFSFSLGFLAFLTGYSVQAVFDLLDSIIFRPRTTGEATGR